MPVIIKSSAHPDEIYKIILIGDERTGKSNLLERLEKNGKWENNMQPTVGLNFNVRITKVSDWTMKLQFWDMSSDKRMDSVRRACYRHTKVAFLVYDITNRDSFLHVEKWWKGFRESDAHPAAEIVLVGNKCDLEDEREVSFEEGRLLADEHVFRFIEVSAKTLENVNYLIHLVATDLFKRYVKAEEEPPRKISKLYENKDKEDDAIVLKKSDLIKLKSEEKKKSVCAN